MKLSRAFLLALNILIKNPMRAILTTLGIMIGIASVIAMVEIGNGTTKALEQTISSMGANNLLVLPGTASNSGVSYGAGTSMTLTPQDADAIKKSIVEVKHVAPIVKVRGQIIYANKNWVPSTINGTTPAFLDVRDWKNFAEGEMFTDQDVRNSSKICVIGKTIAKELFENISPIGKELRLQNISLKVVGVLSSKGANMMGMDQDDILLAPWTTVKNRISGISSSATTQNISTNDTKNSLNKLYPSTQSSLYPPLPANQSADTPLPTRFANIDQILLVASSAQNIPQAIQQVTYLLRDRHRIREEQPEDFNIRDMTEMIKAMSSTSSLMTKLLLCVAMISLVVGGVGIMNIMLVSVTERTKEIGLRMAVGATGKDILLQFLIEAIVLCLIGGAVGIFFGRISSYLITSLLGWPTEASIKAILGAVGVSVSVGTIFGFYPAWKASNMDPIEALRYE